MWDERFEDRVSQCRVVKIWHCNRSLVLPRRRWKCYPVRRFSLDGHGIGAERTCCHTIVVWIWCITRRGLRLYPIREVRVGRKAALMCTIRWMCGCTHHLSAKLSVVCVVSVGVAVRFERSLAIETVMFHYCGSFSHLTRVQSEIRSTFQTSCPLVVVQAILSAHIAE